MPDKPKTARAVQPNRGVEIWYRERLQDFIRDMAQSVLDEVRAAWVEAPPTLGQAMDAAPRSTSVLLKRALEKWGGLWTRKLDDLSTKLADRFTDKNFRATQVSMRESFRQAGFTVKFKPTAASTEAYRAVAAQQVNLIKSIPQQYLKDVQTAVWEGVMKGSNLSSMTEAIKATYGVTYRRAAFIARDQNNKAKAVIENTRRQELGITEAIWQHSAAGKVPRPTHVAMNGKKFKLSEGMYDSAVGKYILPGEEPNCRCISKSIIPGFT